MQENTTVQMMIINIRISHGPGCKVEGTAQTGTDVPQSMQRPKGCTAEHLREDDFDLAYR